MEKNYNKIERLQFAGSGHYRVTILFRNKSYSAVTTDMCSVDEYKSDNRGWKLAGNYLYNGVVRNLGLK